VDKIATLRLAFGTDVLSTALVARAAQRVLFGTVHSIHTRLVLWERLDCHSTVCK
jgi:hypothetical protein